VSASKAYSPEHNQLAGRDARIALVGATGTVGSQIAELIGARNFPHPELKLFARDSSARVVDTGDRSLPVGHFERAQDLAAFDIAFLAVPSDAAAEIIEARPGPTLIDLSAATVPPQDGIAMVAPGLTVGEQFSPSRKGQRFAVPHPAAQVIATILQVLETGGFAAASVMLSASAAGHRGVSELFQQSADLLNARLELDDEPQVSFNIFAPQGTRDLALALAAQIRVLSTHSGRLLLHIVRVPAFHGSGVALFLSGDGAKTEWAERLRSAPGLILVANDDAAGFVDAVGQEGAITRLSLEDAGAVIWCSFDAARLAALTALWIAEALIGRTGSGGH
jgi:aspartate-semialdehyde dehydrogenase